MNPIFLTLFIFGTLVLLRGVYALVAQDVTDDNEHLTGRAAVRHGAILIVLGLAIDGYAIFQWPFVTRAVWWLHSLE